MFIQANDEQICQLLHEASFSKIDQERRNNNEYSRKGHGKNLTKHDRNPLFPIAPRPNEKPRTGESVCKAISNRGGLVHDVDQEPKRMSCGQKDTVAGVPS